MSIDFSFFIDFPTVFQRFVIEFPLKHEKLQGVDVDLTNTATAQANCEAEGAVYKKSDADSYCGEMDAVIAEASFWGNIATVIVVVINQVLKRGIKGSASYAKAHTMEQVAICIKHEEFCI